jgi:hypothetical protein
MMPMVARIGQNNDCVNLKHWRYENAVIAGVGERQEEAQTPPIS